MKNDILKKVYSIIPPDSLHYIEGEDHRTLLSEEEIEVVIESVSADRLLFKPT